MTSRIQDINIKCGPKRTPAETKSQNQNRPEMQSNLPVHRHSPHNTRATRPEKTPTYPAAGSTVTWRLRRNENTKRTMIENKWSMKRIVAVYKAPLSSRWWHVTREAWKFGAPTEACQAGVGSSGSHNSRVTIQWSEVLTLILWNKRSWKVGTHCACQY